MESLEDEYAVEGPKAYTDGRKVGFSGGRREDNPFQEGSWLRESWLMGFEEGEMDRKALAEPALSHPYWH